MALFIIVTYIIGGYMYFLPGVIAGYKKHKNTTIITILNLLVGWTIIGWIGLLIWALTEKNIDYIQELENLANLKDRGAITEEEYNIQKTKLLKAQK